MISKIDKKVIIELQRDGRQSYADLARKLKISESTANRRLARLLKNDIIRVIGVPNPKEIGLGFTCTIRLEVKKDKLRQFGRELAKHPNIYFLSFTTGDFDIVALMMFNSAQELADFMWEDISTKTEVLRTETVVNIEIVKAPWIKNIDLEVLLK